VNSAPDTGDWQRARGHVAAESENRVAKTALDQAAGVCGGRDRISYGSSSVKECRGAGGCTCGDTAIKTARRLGASVMAVCVGREGRGGADLRRTRVGARYRTSGGPMAWLRGVMEDAGEQRVKDELPCGEALDQAHSAAAARTGP